MNRIRTPMLLIGLAAVSVSVFAGTPAELRVVAVSPARHATAPVGTAIHIVFDRPVNPATVGAATLRVFGHASGTAARTVTFLHGNRIVAVTPAEDFFPGEVVLVNLSEALTAADGSPLRGAGFAYQFTTAAKPAARSFVEIARMSSEDGPNTRLYGALAVDFDLDRWIDLGTVNEDTSDLRVFLNRADGTGLFHAFLAPTATGSTPSPNDSADFDNDGLTDVCTANTGGASVSILYGDGDGTFGPHLQRSVGVYPRGIAVLDLDGDADLDIASANADANNASVLVNNGGTFVGTATFFEGGGNGEYGLCAGDMDNDGIYDLVYGARYSQNIIVHRGNGNGTFSIVHTQSAGGMVWMMACGDLNGDGNLDVTAANSSSSNASVLLGRGDGTLAPPVVTAMATGHIPATDLGDMDGDGDLDWVVSNFGAGHWRLFLNNGQAGFTFDQQFQAPSNPSCAIPADFDNDGDLDLTLTDEITNDILLLRNKAIAGDADGDGRLDAADCAPANALVWQIPAAAPALQLVPSAGLTVLGWRAPAASSGVAVEYDVVRSETRDGFAAGSAVCVETADGSDTLAVDATSPASVFYYLVRAANPCGDGSAGTDSSGNARVVRSCP